MYSGSYAASDHLWPAIAATTGGAVPPVVLVPAGVVLRSMYAQVVPESPQLLVCIVPTKGFVQSCSSVKS